MTTDMSPTIEAKSDQLNADDLIGGPRTIRITKVTIIAGEQPVTVHFEGDDGKPWKPCKSMRRVMVAAWGSDAAAYIGRSLTLYRDPKVRFSGLETGGARISHMSHLERDMMLALTVTRGKKAGYTVKTLAQSGAAPREYAVKPITEDVSPQLAELIAKYQAATTAEEVAAIDAERKALWSKLNRDQKQQAKQACDEATERTQPAPEERGDAWEPPQP